jgi:hypothetical protein
MLKQVVLFQEHVEIGMNIFVFISFSNILFLVHVIMLNGIVDLKYVKQKWHVQPIKFIPSMLQHVQKLVII